MTEKVGKIPALVRFIYEYDAVRYQISQNTSIG